MARTNRWSSEEWGDREREWRRSPEGKAELAAREAYYAESDAAEERILALIYSDKR